MSILRTLIPAVLFTALGLPTLAQAPIKSTTKLRPDGTSVTHTIDPENRMEEQKTIDAGGKQIRRTVYPLDARGVATGATFFDANNKVRYKEVYTRDASDRITESQLFSADNRPLGKRLYQYDARGNATIQDYDASGVALARPAPASTSRGRPDKKRR